MLELKFVPYHWADFLGDFKKLHRLHALAQANESQAIMLDPDTGKSNEDKKTNIVPDTFFGFAAIANYSSAALCPESIRKELKQKELEQIVAELKDRLLFFIGVVEERNINFKADRFENF